LKVNWLRLESALYLCAISTDGADYLNRNGTEEIP